MVVVLYISLVKKVICREGDILGYAFICGDMP